MKAGKRYQQWVIVNSKGLFYKDDLSGKGWVKDRNEAAYYNYKQGEGVIKTLGLEDLKVVDGVESTRIKQEFTKNPDGSINAYVTCKKCGSPIDHSDEYGVWCTNECDREKSIEASVKFEKFFNDLINFNENSLRRFK